MSLVCGCCDTHGSKLWFCPAPTTVTHTDMQLCLRTDDVWAFYRTSLQIF